MEPLAWFKGKFITGSNGFAAWELKVNCLVFFANHLLLIFKDSLSIGFCSLVVVSLLSE
jgi:hypothetical protein